MSKGLPRSRGGRIAATAIVFAALAGTAAAATSIRGAQPTIHAISSDPYTDPSTQHQTEVEVVAAGYGQTVVATFQVGRALAGGSTNTGWATSVDRGATWSHGFLPGVTRGGSPPGPYDQATDPTVAYDSAHGVWLIVNVTTRGSGRSWTDEALVVSRSADGLAWAGPRTITAAGGPDQSWIACDNGAQSPRRGTCYVLWSETNSSTGGPFLASTSTDGGITWSTPRAPAGAPSGYDVDAVVQPDGTVVVVAAQGQEMVSFRSTDGGASWSAPSPWVARKHKELAGTLREDPKPSVGVDARGVVYVVWSDCRFRPSCSENDLVLGVSADGVRAPTITPITESSAGTDEVLPAFGVDPSTSGEAATFGLVYYVLDSGCRASACNFDVEYTSSSNGGASWSKPSKLAGPASTGWLPLTVVGRMIGDYSQMPVLGRTAIGVYVTPRPPDPALHLDAYAAVASITRSPTPQLQGAVNAFGATKLSATEGRPGSYTIFVEDRSKGDGFRFRGPGVDKKTGKKFVGRMRWAVHLRPGIYLYGSTRGRLTQRLVVA